MNKKNPLLLTAPPLAPPAFRSRAAIALAAIAAEGRFALQVCTACATVQYPARDACQACLSTTLAWRDVPSGGQILARTIIRASADPYFRLRLPWPIATIALDCGPSVIAHLHGDATDRVRMTLRLDKSGQAVMLAMPAEDTPTMQDDPILREMTCDPSDRRVLITDGRSAIGQAMAAALTQAGAATVFAGIADPWKPYKKLVGEVPLDLTDETSVRTFAAEFGARVDIVINTALHLRPGNILDRRDTITAHEDMEAAYFGPLRLAQSLGPALRARTADGTHPACAW